MKVLVWLLSLLLALPAGETQFAFTADGGQTLSEAALAGLSAVLAETRLTLGADGCDLTCDGVPLAWARTGLIGSGDVAASTEMPGLSGTAIDLAQALGRLLAPWETEKTDTIDLQEAGSARRRLQYVLGEEGWGRMAPQMADLLGIEALSDSTLTGKATFRRYFDRADQEIGAYFYAEKLRLEGVTREVRLEYGLQLDRGFYLAFRCPDSRGTTNTRLSIHLKRTQTGWTGSAEVRETLSGGSSQWTLKGSLPGTLTLEGGRKLDGVSHKYALSLKTAEGEGAYAWTVDGARLLEGGVTWQPGALADRREISANADIAQVSAALAADLLDILRSAAPESWQQLLFAALPTAWIDVQKEDPIP